MVMRFYSLVMRFYSVVMRIYSAVMILRCGNKILRCGNEILQCGNEALVNKLGILAYITVLFPSCIQLICRYSTGFAVRLGDY